MKYFTRLIVLLLLILPAMVHAQFNYTDNGDGTCTITGYTGTGGAVTIPGIINGLTTTSIGTFAFQNKSSLTSVTIPNSVTSIGGLAFIDCYHMTSVTIGNSVTNIGTQAFYQCAAITSVTFPVSLSNLGNQAFAQCNGLTGIYFLGNAPSVGSGVFANESSNPTVYYLAGTTGWGSTFAGLPTVEIQFTYTITNGAVTITGYLGSDSNVTIPNTINGLPVTSIGSGAFYNNNNLVKLTISSNVVNIADNAFYGCTNLTGAYFQGNAPALGLNVFGNDNNVTTYYFAGTTGWGSTYGGLSTVQYQFTYTVTNGTITTTKYVGTNAFATIPDTMYGLPVTSIGDGTFSSCTILTGVTIPNSVTSIGNEAFAYCSSLTSIIIPNSVTNIADNTFISCTSLASVTLPNNIANIPNSAFPLCTSLASVTIPNSVTTIGDSAFFGCSSLANVTLGNSVSNIVEEAFCECYSLTNIAIPNSVTYIDNAAFLDDLNLKAVYFKGNAPALGGSLVVQWDTNATAYYLPGTTGWGATFDGPLPPSGNGIPAVLWNPQPQTDDGSFGVESNHFGFNIIGTSNLVFVVEACTNLSNPIWQPVGTNTLASGAFYFSDSQWTNYPRRFYHIRFP